MFRSPERFIFPHAIHCQGGNVEDDTTSNTSNNRSFEEVLEAHISRRAVLVGGLAGAALTFVGPSMARAHVGSGGRITTGTSGLLSARKKPKIGFTSIPLQAGTMPTIAPEYDYSVLIPWREKLDGSGESFPYAGFTSAQQAESIGIGHDGMWFSGNNDRGVICINHEYGTFPHLNGKKVPASIEDVLLSQHAHGVSVVAVSKTRSGKWKVVKSDLNRRIHANTPVKFSGPAAKSALLANTAGNPMLGTINNCANGYTPWGTYLTCEENFNGYFGSTSTAWSANSIHTRYGFSAAGFGYEWHKFDPRFDLANPAYSNEANRFGWVVEIDPKKPNSAPVKRTALGRFKHEGACVTVGKNNQVVVYMGDDERFDYIYKFVSKGDWKKMIAAGKSPLDEGTLYVARFNEDGTGDWLELSPQNSALSSWTIEDILVYTRLAADAVGATKMDRPEWITVGANGELYCTLTNNSQRGTAGRAGTNSANPQAGNAWGHIIRWKDTDKHVGQSFSWNIYALATEITDAGGQMFGSPDGIWADPDGRIFVQTDGDQPGKNNDQMLVASAVGKEFKRLFTGVKGCEVTGVTVTPDRKTMFVNLQHPGDGSPAVTNFPEPYTGATGAVPRDCTIVITRKNGGVIGS